MDQLWAEAMYYYKEGKTPLILPKELMPISVEVQQAHKEGIEDPLIGLIEAFLERPIPRDWDTYSLDQRILYFADNATERKDIVPRKTVCSMEIWCECLDGKMGCAPKYEMLKINRVLRILGWEIGERQKMKIPPYGMQRYYEKP